MPIAWAVLTLAIGYRRWPPWLASFWGAYAEDTSGLQVTRLGTDDFADRRAVWLPSS